MSEDSQIAASIDEKLCSGEVASLGETVKERRRGRPRDEYQLRMITDLYV
jgi:hypothetical protein